MARAWFKCLIASAELRNGAVTYKEPVDVLEVDLFQRGESFKHVFHVSFQRFVNFNWSLPFFDTRAGLDSKSKLGTPIDDEVLH